MYKVNLIYGELCGNLNYRKAIVETKEMPNCEMASHKVGQKISPNLAKDRSTSNVMLAEGMELGQEWAQGRRARMSRQTKDQAPIIGR